MSGETLALAYLSLAEGLSYLGFLGLVGAVAVALAVMPICRRRGAVAPQLSPVVDRQIRRAAVGSTALLAVATVARVYAQTYSVFGLDEPVTFDLIRVVAFESRWGLRWWLQFEATLLAVGAVVLVCMWPPAGWWSAAAGAGALAVALPMTGHAMSRPDGAGWAWMLQVGHTVAAGLWLGTLAIVLATVRSSRVKASDASGQLTAGLVDIFSPLAMAAVGTILVTGAATAVLYVDHWSQLWRTSYGLTLVGKVALMLATGAVGAYNWRILRPRLGAAASARASLERSASLELALGCLVLAVTAVLGHLPMPHQ